MTDDEALALKPGDVVQFSKKVCTKGARGQKRFLRGTFVKATTHGNYKQKWVVVEVDWKDARGYRRTTDLFARKIELLSKFDPTTAHVFADWLEENGEPRAADMLRKAFPLAAPDRMGT